MKSLITVLVIVVSVIIYIVNFYKLTDCDFEPNYKCEVIHSVGLIPALTIFTVWYGVDE